MKTMLAALPFVLLALLGAPSLAAAAPPMLVAAVTYGSGERVDGSGRVIEETRPVGGFTALRVSGPFDVELKASDRDSVTVRIDDNLAPLVETRVTADERAVLEIDVRSGASFRASRTPVVVVHFKALTELVLRGSGDVRADRINAEDFVLSMSGSTDARIESMNAKRLAAVLAGSGALAVDGGRVDEQAYKLAGSGKVRAGRLEGRHVIVSIAGSGDVEVNAVETLEAKIAGSGDVTYRGSPRVTQRIAGSGSVRRAR